jgi:hypothetical protein
MGRQAPSSNGPKIGGPTGSSTNPSLSSNSRQTTPSGVGMGQTQSNQRGPRIGGPTGSTTHINLVGSRPTTRYSRTVIVDGRTRYLYDDGSYSWSSTGFIVGYLSAQQAAQNQIVYNQAILNAQAQQSQMNVDNAYANGVAQGQANVQVQQSQANQAYLNGVSAGQNGATPSRGMGVGTVLLLVIVGVAVVIGILYVVSRSQS